MVNKMIPGPFIYHMAFRSFFGRSIRISGSTLSYYRKPVTFCPSFYGVIRGKRPKPGKA
jgi:hypothetical protein